MNKTSCPICGKGTEREGNRFRPFCSERCKLIDLGRWASESYRIPAALPNEEGSLDEAIDPLEERSQHPDHSSKNGKNKND